MENSEYNRLITNNKLNELKEIWNIGDLTRYSYHKKCLLEYLLEKNIHTTRMDNYAINNELWIKLYLKYNIVKPLINASLIHLLVFNNGELLLDTLLKKLTVKEKMKLYHVFKRDNYWLLHNNESLIRKIYYKYGIDLPSTFIRLPSISDKSIKASKKLQSALDNFTKVYSDVNEHVINIYLNEFKNKSKINLIRTINDINKLIKIKKLYPDFKLVIKDYDIEINTSVGEYSGYDKTILINQYRHGIMNHELSHLFYDKLEKNSSDAYIEYQSIQKKIIDSEKVENIIKYLKSFHDNYYFMEKRFTELYYAKIKNRYMSFNNYFNKIYQDIKRHHLDYITIDNNDTTIYIEDNLKETVLELIDNECNDYVNILISNYYTEELMLENLLDALLNGLIHDNKYNIECLSGHSKSSFEEEITLSFDEVLADFDAIKNSPKADIIISKLERIVGNELVDFLNNYIKRNRTNKFNSKNKHL